MTFIRSERVAAFFLLVAAAAGLLLANTPAGPALMALQDAHLAIPGTPARPLGGPLDQRRPARDVLLHRRASS